MSRRMCTNKNTFLALGLRPWFTIVFVFSTVVRARRSHDRARSATPRRDIDVFRVVCYLYWLVLLL